MENEDVIFVGVCDLRTIEQTALMTNEGEKDDIAAVGQTSAAHTLCPSIPTRQRRQHIVPGSGHFLALHGG